MNIIDSLIHFLSKASGCRIGRNEWLSSDEMQVYIRCSNRYLNNNYIKALDIANVEVYNKGQGIFTSFLEQFHAINPFEITFIENVFSPRFQNFFLKKGYSQFGELNPPSFYLLK